MKKLRLLSVNEQLHTKKSKTIPLLKSNPQNRKKWKICIPEPFLNCEKIHPLQQGKVNQIISILQKETAVKKIIIFGSSVTNRCHVESDVDVFVQLSKPVPISLSNCNFVYDFWTNHSVDKRLLSEIIDKGVTVYVSDSA